MVELSGFQYEKLQVQKKNHSQANFPNPFCASLQNYYNYYDYYE